MVLGQAVAETSGIFALIVALMLLFGSFPATLPAVFAIIGAGLATGLAGLGTGTGAGIVSAAATTGIARQPEFAPKQTYTMVLAQAISQTTGIYALGISFILILVV
jgi:ATP synthase F0 subunit c